MRKVSGLALLLILLLSSCENVEETPPEFSGPEFFPLEVGSFITYQVDSTRIIQNVEAAYQYQLRVSVTDSFVNGEGNTTYVLQRHTRSNSTSPWKAAGTWSAWKTERQAVVSEGNTSFVKLQFPVSVGIAWNGNAMNSLGGDEQCNGSDCDEYEVSATDPDLIVVQSDDTDVLVKQDVRTEKYTRGVGLVSRQVVVLDYCTAGACFGKQFVDSGLRYNQVMIENGKL